MAVLNDAYYGVGMYSRVRDHRFYPSPDDMPGDGTGHLSHLSPSLLGSMKLSVIEKAVRSRCHPAVYDETVLHQIECIVWNGTPHRGYCPLS